MGNKIVEPTNYILYNNYVAFDDPAEANTGRLSQPGKVLKANFFMGPCKASGIKINVEIPSLSNTQQSDNKQKDNKQKDNKQTDNKQTDNKQTDNKQTDKPNESYNYTIAESYTKYTNALSMVNEAGKGYYGSKSSTEFGDAGGDNAKSKENAAKQDKGTKDFYAGAHMYVQVLLPNEGYTKWHILVNKEIQDATSLKAISNFIQAKKFKEAYKYASSKVQSDGLVFMSAETYLNKDQQIPFLGRCRYAINASEDEDSGEDQSISFAVAPINGVTKKPDEAYVFLVKYNITGDFTNGKAGELYASLVRHLDDVNAGKARLGQPSRDSDDDNTDELDKFLTDQFKTPGDDSMYNRFLQIRNYINDCIKDNTLELKTNDNETNEPKSYAKQMLSYKKTLLRF